MSIIFLIYQNVALKRRIGSWDKKRKDPFVTRTEKPTPKKEWKWRKWKREIYLSWAAHSAWKCESNCWLINPWHFNENSCENIEFLHCEMEFGVTHFYGALLYFSLLFCISFCCVSHCDSICRVLYYDRNEFSILPLVEAGYKCFGVYRSVKWIGVRFASSVFECKHILVKILANGSVPVCCFFYCCCRCSLSPWTNR